MTTPAPGWYADTTDPAFIRWWDGQAWSDHTQPNPAAQEPVSAPSPSAPVAPPFATSEPVAAVAATPAPLATPTPLAAPAAGLIVPPASDAVPSRSDARINRSPSLSVSEPVRLVPPSAATQPAESFGGFAVAPPATGEPAGASATTPWTSSSSFAQPAAAVDLSSADYEPMVRSWAGTRSGSGSRAISGVSTAGGWMLAFTPLVQLGLLALGWVLTDGGTAATTPVVAAGLGLASLLWILIAVVADHRRLGTLGHEYRPSVAWILLGPLMYLVARAIHVYRTARSGVAPTWVYLVLSVVVGASVGALSVTLPREASLTELRLVEATIATDMQEQGVDWTVLCPEQVTAATGSSFVCTAHDTLGPVALVRVTWTTVPGTYEYALATSTTRP